jgi:tRNA nucleotidyltransferase (CCA-adding enzyme)
MRISELLATLAQIARDNKISEPYIVGGLPRDKAFGLTHEIKDIDITTGDKDSFALAMSAAKTWPEAHFNTYDDGHSSLRFKNINVDFSNNFKLPGITKYLKDAGLDNPNDLQEEIYSRDFTINTLLQPMDLTKDVLDTTGVGLKDIEKKVLRTPVNPELTIGFDPRRILRALKLALQFDLEIAIDLQKALVKYRGALVELPLNSVKKQVNKMLEMDSKKAIDMLSEYKLLPVLPLSRMMNLELAKNHMIQHLLEGKRT